MNQVLKCDSPFFKAAAPKIDHPFALYLRSKSYIKTCKIFANPRARERHGPCSAANENKLLKLLLDVGWVEGVILDTEMDTKCSGSDKVSLTL